MKLLIFVGHTPYILVSLFYFNIQCFLLTFFTGYGFQEAVWSWFPSPSAWNCDRAGLRSIEWTERCETWFVRHMAKIRAGEAKPKSHTEWISSLRGLNLTRTLINNSKRLAKTFVNEVVPLR